MTAATPVRVVVPEHETFDPFGFVLRTPAEVAEFEAWLDTFDGWPPANRGEAWEQEAARVAQEIEADWQARQGQGEE